MNYISEITNEMVRWFGILNQKYYNGELVLPIITIQKARQNNLGYLTLDKIWKNKNGENSYYEMNISAHSLHGDIVEIVGIVLHEMVHEYNLLNGIKDHSGAIHNKRFKKEAERVGLVVERSDKCGFGYTFCGEELKSFILNEVNPDGTLFQFARIPDQIETKPRVKRIFKYKCPECDLEIKAKSDTRVLCCNCEVELEIEEG